MNLHVCFAQRSKSLEEVGKFFFYSPSMFFDYFESVTP